MLVFIIKRLLQAIPVLLLVSSATFFMIHAAPGGPFDNERSLPPEILTQLSKRYHLDDPIWKQYLDYMGNLLQGDFGPSYKYASHSVTELIAAGLPATAELSFYAIVFALVVGLSIGIYAALRRNTAGDYLPMSVAMLGICMPTFVLGPILLLVFGIWLGWLPVAGWGQIPGDKILPSITLGSVYAAYIARITRGSRISLMVGFIATAVALTIGVLWGAIAGFIGGKLDAVMMRIVDVLYALPFTIFIVLLTVIFGSSMLLLFLAIGAVEWLTMARIVRSQVLTIRRQEFVDAAVSMGLSPWQIIRRHIIPNTLGPIIVYTTLTIPSVILLESFLSFLGLGIQPPASSWGSLISSGVETMEEYPWLLIFPGLALTLTLFSLNFLGDGLRDALDPRSAKD